MKLFPAAVVAALLAATPAYADPVSFQAEVITACSPVPLMLDESDPDLFLAFARLMAGNITPEQYAQVWHEEAPTADRAVKQFLKDCFGQPI